MPLPVIAATVRTSVAGLCPSGAPWVNVLHFQTVSGTAPTATDFANLDAKLVKLFNGPVYTSGTYLLALCNPAVTWTTVTYTPLDGSGLSTLLPHSQIGSGGAGASSPSEVSMVVTFRTALRGRSYRGRAYLPPFNVGNWTAAGQLVPTQVSQVTNQWVGFGADLNSVNWQHVVASYLHATAQKVTVYSMDATADVQRRRKAP